MWLLSNSLIIVAENVLVRVLVDVPIVVCSEGKLDCGVAILVVGNWLTFILPLLKNYYTCN